MTTKSQQSATEPKKNKNKNELSEQLEQEWFYRNRDHMEGYEGRGRGSIREKVQGLKSINGRYKIVEGGC